MIDAIVWHFEEQWIWYNYALLYRRFFVAGNIEWYLWENDIGKWYLGRFTVFTLTTANVLKKFCQKCSVLLWTVYLYSRMNIIFLLFRFLLVVCVKMSNIASHVMRKGIFRVRYGILTTAQHAAVPKVHSYITWWDCWCR